MNKIGLEHLVKSKSKVAKDFQVTPQGLRSQLEEAVNISKNRILW